MTMATETIPKSVAGMAVAPNLSDYDACRRTFSWTAARAELDGLPRGSGLNIAHEAVDRHAAGARRNHLAIRWLGARAPSATTRSVTSRDCRIASRTCWPGSASWRATGSTR
jgi:hypothetical protein